jgi:hypothetical protein
VVAQEGRGCRVLSKELGGGSDRFGGGSDRSEEAVIVECLISQGSNQSRQ